MKIHVVAENFVKGNGVHTAFVDHVNLLRSKNDIQTVVNNEGHGDVFHAHTYGPYYFLKGLPYKGRRVFTVHVIPDSIKGSLPEWSLLMPFVKWYFKQVYSFADVCIAISPTVKKAIRELGVKTDIVMIYNPIDVDKWRRTPENRKKGREFLGIGEEEFVVLGVGQLQARKGVEDFIDVASALPEARFVWAGGRPLKLLTEGIARIDSKMENAPDNIQFTGMLDLELMPMIYAAADVMLFTSYQENCPLAPVEASASGMPVVFRDIDEYKSLYEYPYLVAGSTEEFILKTRRLMTDKLYYDEGLRLSEKFVSQFDKENIRMKLIHLYEHLNNKSIGRLKPSIANM